ncbi:acyl-CoA dehydrogenase family protein [[Mycobacterium] wendilense]|uniref:Acyl-CoA dehydrogenase family protein n=1 Tax=[Mycobacterium] wendilense TaxID=3064284 RepID=A0ABM9MK25_9MYCO|nr:acyl-CoA dehydrogenase family protein [Mycolicibacterium sp. MU0050]CAJ1587085.1 acyl-CoA dehydrogenase family protein [Mycolicibacterium sp. MU0050]
MDFELTDEQKGLVDATRSLLTAKSSLAGARDLIDGPDGFDTALWRHGVELGWPALTVAEEDGGLGQQIIDLALVTVELGRSLASTPLVPTALVADALGHSDNEQKAKLLQAICEGNLVASWGFAEFRQPWGPAGITARAQSHEGGYLLDGAKVSVQDADSAQLLIVDAVLDDAPARFLVSTDADGLRIVRQNTLDVTRSYCDVTLTQVKVDAAALLASGDEARRSLARTMQLSTVLACAELVGIGSRLLDMTVGYVKEREQFGRPVGSFQAVKHKCADMRIWVQASTAATYYAAMTLDSEHHDSERAVSIAKAYVSDAINRVAGQALQLHGGIGFTWEHDLHLFLRRARVNSMLSGDARHHRERLCASLEADLAGAAG